MYKVTKGRPPVGHTNEQSDGYPPPLPPRPVSPQIASAYPRGAVSFHVAACVVSFPFLMQSERKRKRKRKSNPSKHKNETETKRKRRPKAGRNRKGEAEREKERRKGRDGIPSFPFAGYRSFLSFRPFRILVRAKGKNIFVTKKPFPRSFTRFYFLSYKLEKINL